MGQMNGEIECEKPNEQLYSYEGRIMINGDTIPLDTTNLVLRGMSLRNTEHIYGLAVFTGHETKVMMNSAESKYKKSRLEVFTDSSVKYLFLI